jgi:hypothetical protein
MGEVKADLPEIPVNETAVETVKHKKKVATKFEIGESGILTKAQRAKITVVTDEADPLFNPKVRNPEDLSESLVRLGWLSTNPLAILSDGRIVSGRTKFLSLPKAEKKREIAVPFIVVEMDEESGADATDALDIRVQKLNPMIVAEKVARFLSRGKTEKEFFDLTGVTPEAQHGYLLVLERCPESVQELVRSGAVPFAAAVELARQSEKMSQSELAAEAERIAKVANGGVRVTAKSVRPQTGDERVATKKEVKQFLLDIQGDLPEGKHGGAAGWSCIIGLEVAIGTRSILSAKAALKKIAKGESVKVDFKQYQDRSGHEVKGQEKK